LFLVLVQDRHCVETFYFAAILAQRIDLDGVGRSASANWATRPLRFAVDTTSVFQNLLLAAGEVGQCLGPAAE
jgi:hypothetical protein